jgi:hypothetical protein
VNGEARPAFDRHTLAAKAQDDVLGEGSSNSIVSNSRGGSEIEMRPQESSLDQLLRRERIQNGWLKVGETC